MITVRFLLWPFPNVESYDHGFYLLATVIANLVDAWMYESPISCSLFLARVHSTPSQGEVNCKLFTLVSFPWLLKSEF